MVFWILVALLSAAVTYVVTRPLLQPIADAADASEADIAVYKDQLAEIDADEARGTISKAEAEAARAEVSRRVLRKPDVTPSAAASPASQNLVTPIHLATTLALPLLSLAVYLAFGAPGLPGLPLKERVAAKIDGATPEDMVAKVEARLRQKPDDGQGWDVIAPVYMAQGRYSDAATAFASAIRILGESPRRLMGFADARIRAEDGLVPNDARKALETIRAGDPKRIEPRIWLALAKEQDGKTAEALAEFRALLAEAPADAPWRGVVQDRINMLENPNAAIKPPHGGPSAEDIAAAKSMTPEQRAEMIDRMVSGLAEKLKTNSRDREGWQRLIQAYQMLGRKDDALKAVANAKAGLAGDEAALRQIDDFAKALGIGS